MLDHTGEVAKESIRTKIESFPVTRQDFANSPEIRLGVDNATGSAQINASLEDSTLKISIGSKFDKPRFDFDAKSPVVKELLGNVLKGLPSITMNADVQGSWSNFAIHVNSNLGSELSAGFQKQVQAKIGLAKAQLDQLVSTKIGPAKKKVQDLLGSLSGGPGKTLAGQKEDMKKSLQKAQASATPSAGSPSETGKNLLKGFGF